MTRTLALLAVAALALSLGACGGGDGDESADDPAPTTSAPSPEPESPTNTGPLPPDATDPTDPTGKPETNTLTVSGTVSLGVEPGCTLLEADGFLYLLLGGPEVRDLAEGDGVRVTGTTDPDVMTTCQQGTPLTVSSLEVLPPR